MRRGRPDRRARAAARPSTPGFLKLNGRIHPVSDDDARAISTWANSFSTGENTNYFLYTSRGEYVLTLFEVLTHAQLPFYIELMHQLAERGIPVPQPQTLRDGTRLTTLHGKPCAIVTRLPGGYEPAPGAAHCALAGATLARTHLAAQDFPIRQPNLRGLSWWLETPKVMPFLDEGQAACCRRNWPNSRPPAPPRPGKACPRVLRTATCSAITCCSPAPSTTP